MRRLALVASGALLALAGQAAGQEKQVAIEAFLAACPAALLAPETLPAALERNGLTEIGQVPIQNTITVGYSTGGGPDNINVAVLTQEFSDATRQFCVVAAFDSFTGQDIEGVRQRLEADPLVGKLEGQLMPIVQGATQAYLKKPGADPLLIVILTGTPGTGNFSMETWTFK